VKFQIRRLFFLISRRAELSVPLDVLWFVLFPLAVLRAVRQVGSRTPNEPARHLPAGPGDRSPSLAERFRFVLALNLRQPVPAWTDRLGEPRWQRRITVQGGERLHAALAGPVVIASVHTRGALLLNLWLRATGIPTVVVTTDEPALTDPVVKLRADLASEGRAPISIRPGSGRDIARQLTPGHALMVLPDVDRGRTLTATWRGGRMRVATGAFRLARATGATVVPMVAMETGRWRWRIVIGEPVPADLIAQRSHTAAASWFADQILPTVARRPRQAYGPLLDAVQPAVVQPADGQPAGASSRTGSGTLKEPLTH
jgi:hypothetical protein